jgi:V8-like Glu-specific endopeptidase
MKRFAAAAAFALSLSALAPSAGAITFGEPDGNGHPNVGQLVVDFPDPDGGLFGICSGTLIAPQVFLTAAHCVAFLPGLGIDDAYVSFDSVVDPATSTLLHGTYSFDPAFGISGGGSDAHDIAVVVLDVPVSGITPAQLPTANLLDSMKTAGTLMDQRFTPVGYGCVRNDSTGGPHSLDCDDNERRVADQGFHSLQNKAWMLLNMNPSTGSGGTCFGDSGGPHFLGDSSVVVSITVTGDTWCRATDKTYRTDTANARAFLAQFVTLP